MKKSCFYQGRKYCFVELLTQFLRGHKIEEDSLDYILVLDTCLIYVTPMQGLDIAHGPVLTIPENHAQDYEITFHMYELQILQLRVREKEATKEEVRIVDLYYPLVHDSKTTLRIGPEFVEPLDDDIPIDKERQLWDLNFETYDDNDIDPNLRNEDLGSDVDNGMDEA